MGIDFNLFFVWLPERIFAGVSANRKDKDKVKHLRRDYYCGVGLGISYASNVKMFSWCGHLIDGQI